MTGTLRQELVIKGTPAQALVAAHEHDIELLGRFIVYREFNQVVAFTTTSDAKLTAWIGKTTEPVTPGMLMSYAEAGS